MNSRSPRVEPEAGEQKAGDTARSEGERARSEPQPPRRVEDEGLAGGPEMQLLLDLFREDVDAVDEGL